MVNCLSSCENPDHIAYARALAISQYEPTSCFAFVNHVLEQKAPKAYKELLTAHEEVVRTLPETHITRDFIPYYYTLLPFEYLKHWRKVEIADIQPGDLFIYIDKDYNPDPSSRATNAPSGTHVSFVDSILDTQLVLLDSSKRRRGRHFRQRDSREIPPGKHLIAYSFLDISTDPISGLSEIRFNGQKPLVNKYIHILRIICSL